jgi:hypothetical protein
VGFFRDADLVASCAQLVADSSAHHVLFEHQFDVRCVGRLAGVLEVQRLVGLLAENPFLEQLALSRKLFGQQAVPVQ